MAEDKISRKKLIKLIRKLQERCKIVEGKHQSVVRKHQSLKTEADAAKSKVLELQAQIDDMSDKIHTQSQLMEAQKKAHETEMRKITHSSGSNASSSHPKETTVLRDEIKALKLRLLEAAASPSNEQVDMIQSLQNTVEEYKKKAVDAIQFAELLRDETGEGGDGESSGEEARLRQEVSKLMEENKKLRAVGGEQKRRHIASLTQQLLLARKECTTLRTDNERLTSSVTQLKSDTKLMRDRSAAAPSEQSERIFIQQKQELNREKEVWTQQLIRNKDKISQLENKVKQLEAENGSRLKERDEALDAKKEAESKLGEYAVRVELLEQQLQERETMNAELIEAHADAKQGHEKQLSEVKNQEEERYSRLLAELTAHRIEAKKAMRAKSGELDKVEKELKRLQDQIATGKPDERRIFELAELQARREHRIRQVSDQMKGHMHIIEQQRDTIARYRDEIHTLSEQLEAERLSKKRSMVNVDYLKAIMVKFMQLKDDSQAQVALYPVVAKVLCFSDEEQDMVRELMREQGIYNYVTSFIWPGEQTNNGNSGGGLMKDAPPVIEGNTNSSDSTAGAGGANEDDAAPSNQVGMRSNNDRKEAKEQGKPPMGAVDDEDTLAEV
mmetsp:Transcript_1671/g.2483  ORF Transcript_1671/g.2483 Transcript_1671/m.2483 type:complete len:615 (+) Transcript_1671:92-1936(+)|eukprot:jgi/Bigna1/67431/fgenesh1_pg.3_\